MEKVNLEYISIIWHEMRTPLTSIRWYLSMILEWDMWDISPEARKALNHCYDSSVRLIKLVNDVLVLSKIENWKMEYYPSKIEITEFLKSVYNDIFIEAEEKKIDVKIEIDKNLKQKNIFYDENRLKQVLEKIFEKFSQASCDLQRLNSCWLGIWLALVKNILKDFKSQINVKSEVWKWSNFYFELNLA